MVGQNEENIGDTSWQLVQLDLPDAELQPSVFCACESVKTGLRALSSPLCLLLLERCFQTASFGKPLSQNHFNKDLCSEQAPSSLSSLLLLKWLSQNNSCQRMHRPCLAGGPPLLTLKEWLMQNHSWGRAIFLASQLRPRIPALHIPQIPRCDARHLR